MKIQDLAEWQKDMQAQPRIWYITVLCDGAQDHTGNFYDSKEAAEVEAAYLRSKNRRPHIYSAAIETLSLANRRWGKVAREN